jgi:hypothetical protein
MEVPLTSDPAALDCLAVDLAQPCGGEYAVRQDLAAWEDRERRRIEFRSSLMNARASQEPAEGREMVQESIRRLSAEMRERRPSRMMAELANAH